jgi:hypothetical protein
MIQIQLFDGTVLEFPQGTSQDVIDRVARQETLARQGVAQEQPSEMMQRIEAARAGTLQPSPDALARVANADEMALAQMQPPRTLGQMLYENVIGSGEVDTPGERAGELVRGVAPALVRGAAELVGLPATINLAIDKGAQAIGLMRDDAPESAFMSALSGEGLRSGLSAITGGETEYKAPGRAGQFVSTIGEFTGGAAGAPLRAVVTSGLAGLTSEGAGQAAEAAGLGETGQTVARVAGAFFGPIAVNTGNKTVNAMMNRASQAPSLDTLKSAKTAAYNAVDAAGVTFSPTQTQGLAANVRNALAQSDFVPDVDAQTRAALAIIEKNAGIPLKLGQLDKIRQGLWKRYNAAPNEVAILDMIDEVDTLINSMPSATPLMGAAREANSRFKKAELIENAFQKAADQTAATGSGGNIVNKYRQAVTSIINNPKQAKFFSNDEIAFMRNFVSGSNAENTLRLLGKVSPSGNGLMMALNLGAVAYNPAMIAATATGAGAKYFSDRLAQSGAQALRDAVATGRIPARQAGTFVQDAARVIPGLLAQ